MKEDVDVEFRKTEEGVGVCDCFCQGGFGGGRGEGAGWVVEDPERHSGGWGWKSGVEIWVKGGYKKAFMRLSSLNNYLKGHYVPRFIRRCCLVSYSVTMVMYFGIVIN